MQDAHRRRSIFALLTVLALVRFGQITPAVAADVAILMPGSHGIVPGDFLVRNEERLQRSGIRTIMTTSATNAADAVAKETAQGHKVVIVGMSKGAVDAAAAIAAGARHRVRIRYPFQNPRDPGHAGQIARNVSGPP